MHELEEWGVSRALILGIVFFGLYFTLSHLIPNLPLFTFNWLVGTAPLWLPVGLWMAFWSSWVTYGQSLYLSGRRPILLEMKVPRDIMKSPRAMEHVFSSFSLSSGESSFIHRGWNLQVRPFFSFEIASFGGDVHFYIWCWRDYKPTVEAAIYGQYPEVELIEVEDYATRFRYDPDVHTAWGVEWPLTSKLMGMGDFRINAYPLKTYIDFELDKDPKEEFKIDPLAQILEFMSSIKPTEQLWVQIVIRKCGGKGNVLSPYDEEAKWVSTIKSEVEKIRKKSAVKPTGEHVADFPDPEEVIDAGFPHPTERQKYQLITMERHLGKYPFETGMRGIYWTEEGLSGPVSTGFRWMWRPFGNPNYMTQLRPRRWHCDFDFPWQDFHDIRWVNQTRRVHDAFRRRLFFHSPWKIPTNILTNETLASLWHPPSRTVMAPGIERIAATKASPPANLPK